MFSVSRKGRIMTKVNNNNAVSWPVEPLGLRLRVWGIP
nr:MAG TPA: hypothetical protein [Caudoviricetes sp.]